MLIALKEAVGSKGEEIMKKNHASWLCTTGAATALVASPVWAQADDVGASAGGSQATPNAIEDIVVTARRREEALQSVPIAVTALTAEKIAQSQITTARELAGLAPSLTVGTGNQRDYNRFTIRGQGVTAGANEGVSVYFAEAPISQFIAGGPGLYHDLQNVQVLNGPQGTLFGRNTTGGAVLFTPHRPTASNGGQFELGYGNYNNREIGGVLNVSLVPGKLMIRASGEYRQRDGFTKQADNTALDAVNYKTARLAVLWKPTDTLENYTVAQFTNSSSGGTSMFVRYVNPAGIFQATLAPYVPRLLALDKKSTLATNAHFWESKSLVVVNSTTLDLSPNLLVKNIFSFARSKVAGGFDLDGTPVATSDYAFTPDAGNPSQPGEGRSEAITNELQLQGHTPDHSFEWVLGGFYLTTYPYAFERNIVGFRGAYTYQEAQTRAGSKALFAQGTLDIGKLAPPLDGLKLTLGARYTWDRRAYRIGQYSPVTGACTTIPGNTFPNCFRSLSARFKKPTYAATLDYHFSPDTMAYATYRTGYKSGGLNVVSTAAVPDNFGPETVSDIEVGLKSDFRIGEVPVRFNLAAFHDNYKRVQRTAYGLDVTPITFIGNAASAKIEGVEMMLTLKPLPQLELGLNYSYLDAHYTSFPFKDAALPAPVLPALYNSNLAGVALPYSPKNKVGATLNYTVFDEEKAGRISFNVRANYQSSFRATDQNQPGNILGNYTLVNMGVNWDSMLGTGVDAELFVTNIANIRPVAAAGIFYYSIGYVNETYVEPRMFGVRLKARFGDR